MRFLIIPCYNEFERLQESEVVDCVDNLDCVVVLVNDGSTDKTQELLQQISSLHPAVIKVLNLERNVGKGEAVRAGFNFAISLGANEVGFCDADFSVDSHDLSRIFAKLHESDLTQGVIGSRVAVAGSNIERSVFRHYSGRMFATLVSAILKQHVYDTQCGAKAFRINPIIIKVFSEPFHSRWAFDVEILGRINMLTNREGSPVIELPLLRWVEQPGSKLTVFSKMRTVLELVKIRRSLMCWKSL
jgi:glycosyltransferase involved in cell wall biosynthesis